MSEESKKRSAKSQKTDQEKTLTIEVNRFKSIIDALSGEKWWRIMISVFFVGCILFTGIATVALAIKRLYPYSDITTNGLGATTFKSEKSEVSYWLYNTALFWASSGISVEEGDIISIRSSGKFNTALHHLYDNAKNNTIPEDEWIGPEGVKDDPEKHPGSYYRRRHRIFPGMPTGALVMQVARNKPFDTPDDYDENDQSAQADNFYFIGGERENIYINHPGTLYFCLNDIVFNERTIRDMIVESIEETKPNKDTLKKYRDGSLTALFKLYEQAFSVDFDYLKRDLKETVKQFEEDSFKKDTLLKETNYDALKRCLLDKLKNLGVEGFPQRIDDRIRELAFANTYSSDSLKQLAANALLKEMTANRAIGQMRLGITRVADDSVISELQQYYDGKYKTAWFEDNVGSFLIVIEKKQGNKQ